MNAIRKNWRTALAVAVLLFLITIVAYAQNGSALSWEISEGILLAVGAGLVQGLIWYGAVNSKLTSLSVRMDLLETERREDNRAFEHRYETLLKTLLKEKS